jgi:photosystem II stability/assembly factor-like uncharacterized protein
MPIAPKGAAKIIKKSSSVTFFPHALKAAPRLTSNLMPASKSRASIFSVQPVDIVDADSDGYWESWYIEVDVDAGNLADTTVTQIEFVSADGLNLGISESLEFIGTRSDDNLVYGPFDYTAFQLGVCAEVVLIVRCTNGGAFYELDVPVEAAKPYPTFFSVWVDNTVDVDLDGYFESWDLIVDMDASDLESAVSARIEVSYEGGTIGHFGPFGFTGTATEDNAVLHAMQADSLDLNESQDIAFNVKCVETGESVIVIIPTQGRSKGIHRNADWTSQDVSDELISCLRAIDDSICWATTYNGKVLKTVNGGTRWEEVANLRLLGDLSLVEAIDKNLAFVGVSTAMGEALIFRTSNGGASWESVFTASLPNPDGFAPSINAIHMYDLKNGIAVGDPDEEGWTIVRTSDGGMTWVRDRHGPGARENEYGWAKVAFFDQEGGIWFGTNTSTLYYSANFGKAWVSIDLPHTDANGIAFSDVNTGVITFSDGFSVRTTNGGMSWEEIPPFNEGFDVAPYVALGSGRAFWMSRNSEAYGLAIFESTDAGGTWTRSLLSFGYGPCMHMDFVQASETGAGWAAGYSVLRHSKGTTTTEVRLSNYGCNPILFDSFPNPFNPLTTIRYSLPKPVDVKLVVYDVLGREVEHLVDERKEAGIHEATFHATHLASGVYLCQLTAGQFVQTRKLCYLR